LLFCGTVSAVAMKKIKGCRRDDMDKDDEEEYKRHDDQWKIRVA